VYGYDVVRAQRVKHPGSVVSEERRFFWRRRQQNSVFAALDHLPSHGSDRIQELLGCDLLVATPEQRVPTGMRKSWPSPAGC
jgi:hypothetical protein